VETIVHYTVNPGDDPHITAFGIGFDAASPLVWATSAILLCGDDPALTALADGGLSAMQFASSDVELNLKQDKFRDIVEGSYYKMNNMLKYTSGNFSNSKDAVSHQSMLREKGFKDCFVVAFRNGERINLNSIAKSTP